MKRCSKCSQIKDSMAFNHNSANKDGLRSRCRECEKAVWAVNSKRYRATRRKYVESNRECFRAKAKEYRDSHKEQIREYMLKYREGRRKELSKYATEYYLNRIKHDPAYKLRAYLRSRINIAMKKNYKGGSAVRDLGCTMADFKKYIESFWQPGMTWNNWSRTGWHIDHKVPLVAFDLTDSRQFKKACHYTNLRPMWAQDNIRKGAKI